MRIMRRMARTKAFEPEKALANALALFWQHGYEATSMQMLVEATGLSRSSLYDTFGDKRQLYCAALAQYRQQTEPPLEVDGELSVREAIREKFMEVIEDESRRGCFVVNTAVELSPHDAEITQTVHDSFAVSEQKFLALLELGQASGELPAHLDIRATARFLLNASCGLQVLVKAGQSQAMLQDIVTKTLSVLD